MSPIKALPLVPIKLENPSITVGGKRITFPVEIESGSYLEFTSLNDCKLYNKQGAMIREIELRGDIPRVQPGDNSIRFTCDGPTDASARARVTVICHGESI